jgi:hypothetical protein
MSQTSEAHKTTDHDTIRHWIEERGGKPATVGDTADNGEPGILRVDFPSDGQDQGLWHIGWDEFFEKFDKEHLAFLYQDETKGGQTSRFCKFVQR